MDENGDNTIAGDKISFDASPSTFSESIVLAYIFHAETWMSEMDEAIAEGSLEKFASVGIYLEDSSAALGLLRVRAACHKLGLWAASRDPQGDTGREEAQKLLQACRHEHELGKVFLKELYRRNATGVFTRVDHEVKVRL